MRFVRIVILGGLLGSQAAFALAPTRNCPRPTAQEPTTRRNDWTLLENLTAAKAQYENLYRSGKRIQDRAFWSEAHDSYVIARKNGLIRVDASFIRHLSEQMAVALDNGYADFLFYPDMGHVHLYASHADARELDAIADENARFEAMLRMPTLITLFHTAELLRLRLGDWFDGPLVDDPWLRWRYYSRNFLAENQDGKTPQVIFAKDPRYNTVRSIEGFSMRNSLYFSGSQDGCFAVTTKQGVLYFDLAEH